MGKQRYDTASRFVASIVGAKPDLTRMQLHRICYFLQEFGQSDTKFRFRMYRYGPYSREVDRAMRYLEDYGAISTTETDDGFDFRFSPGKYFEEANDELLKEQKDLVSRLASKQVWQLELLASVHFFRRILRDHEATDIDRNRLIHEVRLVKPGHDENTVGRAIDELAELENAFVPEPATA